jgi:hypothetical protein
LVRGAAENAMRAIQNRIAVWRDLARIDAYLDLRVVRR